MKSLRVLMLVENLPVPFDRRVWQEACTLRDAGHQVTVICPKGRGLTSGRETIEGITVLRHSLPLEASGIAAFCLEYIAALFHQFRLALKVWFGQRFDVIHVANPPDLLFLVALPFKLFGVKLIYDHHDLGPELFEQKFRRRGPGYWLMRGAERLSFLFADVVVSTNNSYRKVALTRGRQPPDRVFVVRSGPDPMLMRSVASDDAIRRKAVHILGYVGIMGSQDGIGDLLEITRHLVHRLGRRDVHLMLVGDGPELAGAKRKAMQLGLASYVTFTGYLTGPALHKVLSSIDIGLCPDPANDYTTRCTMNKVMEYMAFGKPIVQFELEEGRVSAQDAALYAASGNIVEFAGHIERLIADPSLRAEMGRRGRERLERELSWQVEAPKLLAAYAKLGDREAGYRGYVQGERARTTAP